ncbi:MAG: hypothetical protein HC802_07990 [Caldilineaceae bacterium]|nr:hypothetical protein [Caldilineaceae bacterium]
MRIRPPHNRALHRAVCRLLRICLALISALMLAACNPFASDPEPELPIDFAPVLPEGWEPVGDWQPVNIDGDEDEEYLLFYTYDSGQVGAVIYDAQQNTGFVPLPVNPTQPDATAQPIPIPNQPSPFYIPYRILPNYWEGTAQGFIAAPGQSDAISFNTVYDPDLSSSSSAANTDDTTATGGEPAMNELVIRGGNTYVTFVWWRDLQTGYAASQVSGKQAVGGVNWSDWDENPVPITDLLSSSPVTGVNARSYLCRTTDYTRVLTSTQPSVTFAPTDGGIAFCGGGIPPIHSTRRRDAGVPSTR